MVLRGRAEKRRARTCLGQMRARWRSKCWSAGCVLGASWILDAREVAATVDGNDEHPVRLSGTNGSVFLGALGVSDECLYVLLLELPDAVDGFPIRIKLTGTGLADDAHEEFA